MFDDLTDESFPDEFSPGCWLQHGDENSLENTKSEMVIDTSDQIKP
jgi:hypothetical protein